MAEMQIPEEVTPGYVESETDELNRMPPTQEFWLEGNQVEQLTKMVLRYEEEQRGYWFDAVYVERFNVTRINVSLSKVAHKIKLREFLEGSDYVEIDYDTMESTNLDDVHLIEEQLGLI